MSVVANIPQDEILKAAREIAARMDDAKWPSLAERTRRGDSDDEEEVQIAVAAIKRGIDMAAQALVSA